MIHKISNVSSSKTRKLDNKRKTKNKIFKSILSEQKKKHANSSRESHISEVRPKKNTNDQNNSTPDTQQILVEHLMRVNELKDKSSRKNPTHPSDAYNQIEDTVTSYLSEKNGTKEHRNIEVFINDELKSNKRL